MSADGLSQKWGFGGFFIKNIKKKNIIYDYEFELNKYLSKLKR
ncbi:Uncharacterised protein [uncultured archaeon]|nr:Uncharacterised protein [uncultured archaeon]